MNPPQGAPLWKEIVHLIRSMPKPPVRARVRTWTGIEGHEDNREAVVFFDGLDVWVIDNGERIQIATQESALLWDNVKLDGYRGGSVVADNWVKVHLVGSFAYIRESKGVVVAEDVLLGRGCWVVEVPGLRRDDPERVTRLWVDKEHGFILRSRWVDDSEAVSELTELTIGRVTRPWVQELGKEPPGAEGS